MKDLFLSIFNIFRYAGRAITLLRNFLFNIIFLFLLIVVALAVFGGGKKQAIGPNSALLLTISGDIVEEKQMIDPLSEIFNEALGISRLPQETLLQDILDAIHAARRDDRINAIVLDLQDMGMSSIGQTREIGEALVEFQNAGKTVIAAEDFYTQNKYLLASYADRLFLSPMGVVDLHGLGAYRLYFHDALEKLKINYHVFRIGTYKSALEPITRNSMSDEAKEQNAEWLEGLWQQFRETIVSRRNISYETIDLYTNHVSTLLRQAGGDTALLAVQTGLVDELKSREELRTYLAGITSPSGQSGFRHVTFKEYLRTLPRSYESSDGTADGVGIIIAQGNILTGEQPPGTIGSETLVSLLQQARNDSSIKAVVLRINTGGGSVYASEIIRRELQELQKAGKPYVVSMGNMAASGGYWIAAEADEIWAYPSTITGSIGIFGAIPTFEDSLAQLGIYNDGIGTTALSAGLDLTQPLSLELQEAIQLTINHGYQKFLDIVASGRNLSPEGLAAVGDGRVFDGATAKELGLVDQLGGLGEAIASAAKLAGLETYTPRYIKASPSFAQVLMQQLGSEIQAILPTWQPPAGLAAMARLLSESSATIVLFNDPKGIYAHCMINSY